MTALFRQLGLIWQKLNGTQKITLLLVIVSVVGAAIFLIFDPSPLVSLYPIETLSAKDREDVRDYLQAEGISFDERAEGFFIAEEKASSLRRGLTALGIPHHEQSKGFELFDGNTWIKGEKELQVLEMRALKGQLERDISEYESIRNAKVILDLAPQRAFGSSPFKTKASVILTLKPNTHLSSSQILAIISHLTGAVRGLEPHMIAISDTTGKLYQAIDFEGKGKLLENVQFDFEEHIQEKMHALLMKLVGQGEFHLSVQAIFDPLTKKISSFSALVLIDGHEEIKEIEKHLHTLLQGYGIEETLIVERASFLKLSSIESSEKPSPHVPYVALFITSAVMVMAMLAILLLFKRKKQGEERARFETQIDFQKLGHTLKQQDPKSIALLLSYLEPSKAKKILSTLPDSLQNRVSSYLEEIERESH